MGREELAYSSAALRPHLAIRRWRCASNSGFELGRRLAADSVEKLEGLASGLVLGGHSTLDEVAIVDPGSI